jgi:hypothetical protein
MECLDDSKACLSVSNFMLNDIEKMYRESLLMDKPSSALKVTI